MEDKLDHANAFVAKELVRLGKEKDERSWNHGMSDEDYFKLSGQMI